MLLHGMAWRHGWQTRQNTQAGRAGRWTFTTELPPPCPPFHVAPLLSLCSLLSLYFLRLHHRAVCGGAFVRRLFLKRGCGDTVQDGQDRWIPFWAAFWRADALMITLSNTRRRCATGTRLPPLPRALFASACGQLRMAFHALRAALPDTVGCGGFSRYTI